MNTKTSSTHYLKLKISFAVNLKSDYKFKYIPQLKIKRLLLL